MKTVKFNFEVPLELSIEIDKLLIDIRSKGMVKTKVELIIELLQMGITEGREIL